MATVPVEITWTAGQIVTAAQLNSNLRDAINFIIGPPLCICRQTLAQSIANTTWAGLTFDTEDINRDSMHSTVTNTSRLTAVTAGWYRLEASSGFVSNATGQRAFEWAVNTSRRSPASWINATAGGLATMSHWAVTLFLNVGDFVEALAWQNSGGALNTASGTAENQAYVAAQWAST